jgi:hypothetical protein
LWARPWPPIAGESTGTGYSVSAGIAQNCYGFGGNGIHAGRTAIGCFGESRTGPAGQNVVNTVFCVGKRPGGNAVLTVMASGCYAAPGGGGTSSATYKYNKP